MDKVTFRIYQDPAAAYADVVAGNLDYIDDSIIPADQLVGDAYKSDLPDRNLAAGVAAWAGSGSPERPAAEGQRRPAQGHLDGHRP